MALRDYKTFDKSCEWNFTDDGGALAAVPMATFVVPGDVFLNGRIIVLEDVTGPPGSAFQFTTITEPNILGTSPGTPVVAGTIPFALGAFAYQAVQPINFISILGPLTAGRVIFIGRFMHLAEGDQI